MNPAKKINPMVKIIIAAVVALAITIAIIFFRGGISLPYSTISAVESSITYYIVSF